MTASVLIAACGGSSSDSDESREGTTTVVSDGGSGGTVRTSSGTTETTVATGTDDGGSSVDEAIEFSELWDRQQELVGDRVVVHAKVFFRLDCASPGDGAAPPCVATGFLTDPATEDLPLYEDGDAFPLWTDGHVVACGTQTLDAAFQCAGFEHDTEYVIDGALEHTVLAGRTTEELEFEADNKEQR